MNTIEQNRIGEFTDVAGRILYNGEEENAERTSRVNERTVKRQQLTKGLRWIGATVLIASAATFLFQGLNLENSVVRYLTFLGLTTALAGAGVFCGMGLKDDKGARTFLGITAAFLTAHFTQLGAFIYSLVQNMQGKVPLYFLYQAPSAAVAFGITAVALLLLIPLTYAGLASLARVEAKRLTLVYFLANAALLIPVREPNAVALIASALVPLLLFADLKYFGKQPAMKNWEGRVVRTLMFVPLAALILRTGLLYGTSALFFSMLYAVLGAVFFFIIPQQMKDKEAASIVQAFGLAPIAGAWVLLVHSFLGVEYAGYINREQLRLFIPLTYLPLSMIIAVLSFFSLDSGVVYRRLAALVAICSMFYYLAAVGGLPAAFLLVLVSIVILGYSFALQEKGLFISGVLGMAIGLPYHLFYAVDVADISPWLLLAVTGTVVVLASSYIERNYQRMIDAAGQFRARIAAWK